ncbi:SDR family oxidoreductase [Pseudomonas aeruginosa]|uniref:SDR family NAD(P)-dependent oxidoreductase n=1 Tax=Pseudomonas aeruginosa TaxID=287 RepID=UPI00071BAD88|nr:SDR family oxidoreductase [Pseudomonas aeruginosa]KSJ03930.1 SDR family oxidoreductase [Pseudomonas aeruginosa]
MTSKLGTALITGASSGIGAIYADRLAARGYDLILVARNHGRLNELAKKLSDSHGHSVEVVVADLTEREDLRRVENLLRTNMGITALVNNAGIGVTASLSDVDVDKLDEMISLNVRALMRLSYAAAPGFVERGGGAIINIASITGIAPEVIPGAGVYGGTKAFVIAFTQSLHKELAAKSLRIQAVAPGATATDFWEIVGIPVSHLPQEIVMDAEDMVDAALAGFDQGELITIPSLPDMADWEAYETSRQKLMPNLSRKEPAKRYQRQ